MKRGLIFICAMVMVCSWTYGEVADDLRKAEDVFHFLPSGSVQLRGGLEKDIQNSLEHWQKGSLPYAKLAAMYRTERKQFAIGEMWGKAVRSGSMFYRYTHDAELKKLLDGTVDDVLSMVRENGSIAVTPVEKQPDKDNQGDLWERKYVLLALSQYYRQVEQSSRVLEAIRREALSIVNQVGDAPKTDITLIGWSPNKIESSSVLEPIMRVYFLTGDRQFLDFAEYVVRKGGCHGCNLFDEAYRGVWPRAMGNMYPKAYEMLSVFEGLAEYYRATGNPRWLQALKNMFRGVWEREITIIGNGGTDEPYFFRYTGECWGDTKFEQTNPWVKRSMETCIGVTWMKYCSHVLRLTGDIDCVEAIEKYVYNGLLGAMKPSGDGFSYVNLLNGEKVTNKGWGYDFDGITVTCCNLNGPMGLAYIPLVLAMQAKEGPVLNLYNAARIEALTEKGRKVKLDVDTEFPKNGEVCVTVTPEKKEKFTLRLRIPSWSKTTEVMLNGERVVRGVKAGEYLLLRRTWNVGDQVTLKLDLHGELLDAPHGIYPAGERFKAVKYGPIVLARDENTDAAYNQPVTVVADAERHVSLKAVVPTLPGTRLEFAVPTKDGDIRMIDYASVNGWNGKHVCTWLPMKNEK